ncbi:MAG: hypothetical protein GY838_16695 [bacterium]|nr:hypothetical protein [bacterium]
MSQSRIFFLTALAVLVVATPLLADEQFDQPVILTSAGQSVDVKLAGVLLTRLGIEHTVVTEATSADLEGFKTLLMVPGYSSKGLGAAGVSREDEMARVEELLAGSAEAGVKVLVLHLGGKARRGVQSDDFNAKAAAGADLAIVVAQGDEDGFFTDVCKKNEVPLEIVDLMADTMKPLGVAIAK